MREELRLPAFFFTLFLRYVNTLSMKYNWLDLSVGDALHPMKYVAKKSFETATHYMNRYLNDPNAMGWHAEVPLELAQNSMREYLNETGWKRPGWSGVGNDSFVFMDGGTTRSFDMVLQSIAKHVARANEKRRKCDRVKPAIIMPVPTYGFFFKTAQLHGIEVVTVERDIHDNGRLDMARLKDKICQCLDEKKRIVAYYDCTPHNPLGFIRSHAETESVYEMMQALKNHYAQADKKVPVGKPFEINGKKFRPTCQHLSQYPVLIDDLVYDGLQYDRRKQVAAFGKICDDAYDHTVTLMGPSKAGLAGMRTGIIVGHPDRLLPIREMLKWQNYFPSYATLKTIETFYAPFGDDKFQKVKHMARLNADHRFNGLLMKALINGVDSMNELNHFDRKKIIRTACKHYAMDEDEVIAKKLSPVRGAKIITTPEAGFFHLIDFSEGASQVYDDTLRLKLTHEFSVIMVPLGWADKTYEQDVNRITFAISQDKIFDYADRVRQCSEAFFKEQDRRPSVSRPACQLR